jgi:hypothetical protein
MSVPGVDSGLSVAATLGAKGHHADEVPRALGIETVNKGPSGVTLA